MQMAKNIMYSIQLILFIAVGMYNANQKFYYERQYSMIQTISNFILTTNQFVAEVIEVALPRIFMENISGG